MTQEFKIPGQQTYIIKDIEKIRTPRLLVFSDRVQNNLQRMKNYLEEVVPNSGYKHLCPHVKTNKSSYIIKQMLAAGITDFKATPNEVEMLIDCGVNNIFIAYPLLYLDAVSLADLIKKHSTVEILVQIGSIEHFDILQKVAVEKNIIWNYYIDLDVGMHRTGIAPKKAIELYTRIKDNKRFRFVGLHGYDGHIHFKTEEKRIEESQKSMAVLKGVYDEFRQNDISVEKIVVAGSPAFRSDLKILHNTIPKDTHIFVSPGTWILWDSQYDANIPNEFEFAALILAQVIDVGENQITLNLGHKRWAAENGPVTVFSQGYIKVRSYNEEHIIFDTIGETTYHIGDYVMVVPRHVCPTVNLYDNFILINSDGKIENESIKIDGRNR